MNFDKIKIDLIEVLSEVGAVLASYRNEAKVLGSKNKFDLLAEADIAAEKILLEYLHSKFPKHDILSEESGQITSKSEFRWIIDPLDGTLNFLNGLDEYCVAVALEVSGEIQLSMIYKPVSQRFYYARKGMGAFVNDNRLVASTQTRLADALIAFDNTSKIPFREQMFDLLREVSMHSRQFRTTGSSSLNLALLAEGKFQGYFKNIINYWDLAPGVLIAKEAGLVALDFNGGEVSPKTTNIVVGSQQLVSELLKVIPDEYKAK